MSPLKQIIELCHDALLKLQVLHMHTIKVVLAVNNAFDYQINDIIAIAKKNQLNPLDLANQVIDIININSLFASITVSGAGFINIKLSDNYLTDYIMQDNYYKFNTDDNDIVVLDYSSPNLAKEMHVGHLRSTLIGDALYRIFTYVGKKIVKQNHVGDWGTPFGMLIAFLLSCDDNINMIEHKLHDLEECYRKAKLEFDSNSEFKTLAHHCVVVLQNWQEYGSYGEKVYDYWKMLTNVSLLHCQHIYDLLGISLTVSDVKAESFYNTMLPDIITQLKQNNMLIQSQNALCVFLNDSKTPFIVQKSDGSYLYATTDLATIKYRNDTLKAKRIIYVVDSRQSLHFKQLFETAKLAHFVGEDIVLEHVSFGMMLNKSGQPFKTREGGTFKLVDLINEAINRAKIILHNNNLSSESANIIGLAAIKYADLSKNRNSNYIFDVDRMLSFDGNTAPYILYAYARIKSILQKSHFDITYISSFKISVSNDLEHDLLVMLSRFTDVIESIVDTCYIHYLCNYLYELTVCFMQFYETYKVLSKQESMQSRLAILLHIAKILSLGLSLLGIYTVESM